MFIAPLLAAAALIHAGPIVIKPDISDGESITKMRTIKVIVQSDSVITQVEFYVNDDLRDSATSTPYTFHLDPLAEKDGDEKLTFTAYNTEGGKASKSLSVHIDSGASKGAAANTQTAKDFLTQSKWDDAIYSARIALKADPNFTAAQLVLAHAFLMKGVYDKAQEFAENAVKSDPKSVEAIEVLSAIEIEHSFGSLSSSGDKSAFVNSMSDAIGKAVEARHKILDQDFDQNSSSASADLVKYADLSIRTKHYSAAISALGDAFSKNNFKTDLGDRIAYSQLRLGRFTDLQKTLALMKKNNTIDGYSYAIWAAMDQYLGDEKGADENIKDAIEDAPNDVGVKTAQAYIALRRAKMTTLTSLASNLYTDQGQLAEVSYYLAVLEDRLRNFEESDKAFKLTVLTDPLLYQMYLERGNETLIPVLSKKATGDEKAYDLLNTQKMFEAARQAKPDSAEALTAIAVMNLTQGKLSDGQTAAEGATKAAPDYAAGHYALACALSLIQDSLNAQASKLQRDSAGSIDAATQSKIDKLRKGAETLTAQANTEFAAAKRLDPKRLEGGEMPSANQAFAYYYVNGQLPLITAPK